jgi:hypothetical protein
MTEKVIRGNYHSGNKDLKIEKVIEKKYFNIVLNITKHQ